MARISEVFRSTNLVHMACHGTQNSTDALSSGFCLSNGNLTVSRLMNLDLKNAFFAFLSACETAKGDEKQPDQTVHLAAAMLFVGFRSVVATMW
jgi:CHAT domain-containing protein